MHAPPAPRDPARHVGWPGSLRSRPRSVGQFALALVILLGAVAGGSAAQAQDEDALRNDAPRLLYLPMRWCVLEGTAAARRDPDRVVLERIRRASSILAPRAGITVRSAINRSLASLGFPVIRDPRPRLGRLGDVQTPLESTGEYSVVVDRCAQAWQRMERAAGGRIDFGGLSKGPVAVIIGDFVTSSGAVDGRVWGFAYSASSNPDYCDARRATIRRATGGSLLVVDTSDGQPSPLLDRRLLAHEIGHILRLGHGDGRDNPGTPSSLIDKFCDAAENPDILPGSLMTYSLTFENMETWQQRLPRNVISRHPAGLQSMPFLQPRVRQVRRPLLQRIANEGSRVVRRLVPRTRPPLSPLPRLWSAGLRGDGYSDDLRDVPREEGDAVPPVADLAEVDVSVDPDDGSVDVSVTPEPGLDPEGTQEGGGAIDSDGDPSTGGSPGTIPGNPFPEWAGLLGLELVTRLRVEDGVPVPEAWRWDALAGAWEALLPPPEVVRTDRIAESEHAEGADVPDAVPDSLALSIPANIIELAQDFRVAALLRTELPDGRIVVDTIPADPASGEMVPMSLRDVEYPVCAVNRDALRPGVARPGERVTLEIDGFEQAGDVSVWLSDGRQPLARLPYTEQACDLPFVAEFTLPDDLGLGSQAGEDGDSQPREGLFMLQVVLEGTGLTAECPILVGDPELPPWAGETPPASLLAAPEA